MTGAPVNGRHVRRLRVVTLVESLRAAGGAERLAREIAMRLDRQRFESIMCVSRAPLPDETDVVLSGVGRQLAEAGVRVIRLNRRSTFWLWSWWPLVSLLRRERIDIIHAHMFGSNFWATVLGRLTRVPVVVAHEHSWSFEGRPVKRLLDRWVIARWSSGFIAVSREDRRRMIELEKIDPDRVHYIPNGIASPPVAERHDVRAELGIGPEDPVIGFVGRLAKPKALETLIRASHLLRPEFPRLRVLIAGDGDRAGLEALARQLGLDETVLFLGHRSDVPDVLFAVDVAVSSSVSEGSPLAIMEYMEAGKPVVATRVGGVPDLVEHGIHGLLVAPGNHRSMAAAVAELLRDPDRRARMGSLARERSRERFDVAVMVRTIEALYERLYEESTATGRRAGSLRRSRASARRARPARPPPPRPRPPRPPAPPRPWRRRSGRRPSRPPGPPGWEARGWSPSPGARPRRGS